MNQVALIQSCISGDVFKEKWNEFDIFFVREILVHLLKVFSVIRAKIRKGLHFEKEDHRSLRAAPPDYFAKIRFDVAKFFSLKTIVRSETEEDDIDACVDAEIEAVKRVESCIAGISGINHADRMAVVFQPRLENRGVSLAVRIEQILSGGEAVAEGDDGDRIFGRRRPRRGGIGAAAREDQGGRQYDGRLTDVKSRSFDGKIGKVR